MVIRNPGCECGYRVLIQNDSDEEIPAHSVVVVSFVEKITISGSARAFLTHVVQYGSGTTGWQRQLVTGESAIEAEAKGNSLL